MEKLLALDLSTNTGFAYGSPAGEPIFGTKKLPSTGDDIGRFSDAFVQWLDDLITLEGFDFMVFESPILSAGKTSAVTARKLMGLAVLTELVAFRRHIPCREGNLMTVKKFFAGSGRASKQDMINAAAKYGWYVRTDDEADALGLWAWSVTRLTNVRRFDMGMLGAEHA